MRLTFLTSLVAVCALSPSAFAAPSLRVATDQRGDFLVVGNTLGWDCGASAPAPIIGSVPGPCGGSVGDSAPDVFWRSDDVGATAAMTWMPTEARSQASLSIPPTATVTHAFLYWAGETQGLPNVVDDTVTFDRPDGQGGTLFSTAVTAGVADQFVVGAQYFQAVADVTSVVQAQGSGVYRVSDLETVDLVNRADNVTFAAWSLVVLYQDPTEPSRNLAVFDGLDLVDGAPVTASLSGFLVPTAGFDAKLGVIAYEGDEQGSGDRLLFGSAPLSMSDALVDAENPANNFFNSSRTSLGLPTSNAGDLPQLTGTARSMASFDLDVVDITDRLSPGQTQADVAATTEGDVYFLGAFVTAISTLKPDFTTSTKTVVDLDGGLVLPGDSLEYTIDVVNDGNDAAIGVVLTDVLPAGVTYQPGSLEIVSGPGMGPLTDAQGDDRGEVDGGVVTVRLGVGADATQGGTMAVGETTTLRFVVSVDALASGTIANQASISAAGELGSPVEQTPTDGNGGAAGAPSTDVEVGGCAPGEDCTDSDGDGLFDADELALGTDPLDADSDDDGVPDGAEPAYDVDSDGDGLINALDADSDDDGLFDGTELGIVTPSPDTDEAAGAFVPDADAGASTTDPLAADSDGGGVDDGVEDANGDGAIDPGETDPNDPTDDIPEPGVGGGGSVGGGSVGGAAPGGGSSEGGSSGSGTAGPEDFGYQGGPLCAAGAPGSAPPGGVAGLLLALAAFVRRRRRVGAP